MSFGDFLTGATVGNAEQIDVKRKERRADEDRSLAYKQGLGQLVLEGLVNGTVRPEFGSHVLGEMQRLSEPRRPAGGLEGFLGASQQPATPTLDTLTQGGWRQGFIDPADKAAQDFQAELTRKDMGEDRNFRNKMNQLPTFTEFLQTQMGISEDMAHQAAIKVLYGEDVFGATGAAGEYWDPVNKRPFRGQRDPLRGIIDVTTNLPVPNARASKIEYEDRPDTHERLMIDRYAPAGEQIISRVPNATAGYRPDSPWYYPPMGVAFQNNEATPILDPVTHLPIGPQGTEPAPQANPEYDTLKQALDYVDKVAREDIALLKDSPAYAGNPEALLVVLTHARDKAAVGLHYKSYQDLLDQLSAQKAKVPAAPKTGAGAGRSLAPGNASPTAPQQDGFTLDKNKAAYKITPGGGQ